MNRVFVFVVLVVSSTSTSDYSLTLDEKSPIDVPIFHFPHPYELIDNFQSNFVLSSDQRQLFLTKVIDRDAWCSSNVCPCESCSFVVHLFSNEKPFDQFSSINITINDINDHTCLFVDVQRNVSLSESVQVGHRFALARSVDYDSGVNGQVTFDLLQPADFFQLDVVPISASEYAIYAVVRRPLDREAFDQYRLVIAAHDHGTPHTRSNQTSILVRIVDENDNAPKFDQPEYSIEVSCSLAARPRSARVEPLSSRYRRTRPSAVICCTSRPPTPIKASTVCSSIRSSIRRMSRRSRSALTRAQA
jgi:hypothetical protein